MMFAMNKSYPYIRQKIGLAYTMGGFGVFSLLGMILFSHKYFSDFSALLVIVK